MELFAVDWRWVLVAPCTTAEACSVTCIVMRSSTWAARKSLARSVNREDGDQSEPAEDWPGVADWRLSASFTYWSSGVGSAVRAFFSLAARQLNKRNERMKIRLCISISVNRAGIDEGFTFAV